MVFIFTAILYGSDGRGVIGYGTSLFAIAGHLFSLNLGRGFVSSTLKDESRKREQINSFLTINFLCGLIASGAGLIFWYFSPSGHEILTPIQAIFFSLTSLFHVWTANGNFFFSSFDKTSLQEAVIIAVRTTVIFTLLVLLYLKNKNLDLFISFYCLILLAGVLIEKFVLLGELGAVKLSRLTFKIKTETLIQIIKSTTAHHIDYLSFNLFPLILTVISASFLTKSDLGQLNFVIQLLNLIFLFSVTANIRVSSYISQSGYSAKFENIKKLLLFTTTISAISVATIYTGLSFETFNQYVADFKETKDLFIIAASGIPGFILYQFLNPLWIEQKRENITCKAHLSIFAVCLATTPWLLKRYQLMGAAISLAIFYLGVMLHGLFSLYFFVKKNGKAKGESPIRILKN